MALTPEQLKNRSTGFGGTDMVAICGESNYTAAIDVWLEKRHGLGLPVDVDPRKFDGNERTDWGHMLEPVIASKYAEDTGDMLIEPMDDSGATISFRHPDRPWQMGTPDRLVYETVDSAKEAGKRGHRPLLNVLNASTNELVKGIYRPEKIWEGKTHGFMAAKNYDFERMEVPDDKRIQVAWYMSLTGVKDADLSALFDTHLYRVFHIPHDQEVEDYLLEEAELFWKKITDGIEPSPDGTNGFDDYLQGRFQLHQADMVEAPIETLKHLAEYKRCRADKKVAEAKMKLAAQEVKNSIGHNAGLLGADGKPLVTWKRKARGSTSYGRLADHLRDIGGISDADFDAAKDEYTGEPSRDFRVK